jgi:hypothetical protein
MLVLEIAAGVVLGYAIIHNRERLLALAKWLGIVAFWLLMFVIGLAITYAVSLCVIWLAQQAGYAANWDYAIVLTGFAYCAFAMVSMIRDANLLGGLVNGAVFFAALFLFKAVHG